jgi:hypothetical protein
LRAFVAVFRATCRFFQAEGSFSPFGGGSNRRLQFQLGLFRSAMVAMVQRLDAHSFFAIRS